jgi:TRAP-type C4-dicarboxylate transport system substrate-binding protein
MFVKRLLLTVVLTAAGAAQAQEVVLKFHHPLPPSSRAHQGFIAPWCEKVAAESSKRMTCQLYPAMQLGGTPAQLLDQVRDGVVDLAWTLPGYSPGRFPLVEVFELPFLMRDGVGASKALWDFVQQHDAAEFKDVLPIAFHVHGGGLFHMVKKPIAKLEDLQGLKVRAPNRQSTKLLAQLGATPVGMPVTQVAESLSKGVIDGTLLPYEVLPAVKVDQLTKFHIESDAGGAKFHTLVFIFAMNRAKYNSLPADLKKIIDNNRGLELSGKIGQNFVDADAAVRQKLPAQSITQLSKTEVERWRKAGQVVTDEWVKEVTAKGANGQQLLDAAQALITKYSK